MPNAQTKPPSGKPESTSRKAAPEDDGKTPDVEDHPIASVFDPFLKPAEFQWWGSQNLNATTEAFSASMSGASQIMGEAARFLNERIHEDLNTAKALFACRTGEDYFRTGSAFFDNTVRAYADQTAKMVHLAADATAATCKPGEDCAKTALHSIARIPRHNGMFV